MYAAEYGQTSAFLCEPGALTLCRLVTDNTHPLRLGGNFFADETSAFLLEHSGADPKISDFDADRLAGPDLTAKLCLFHACEKEEFLSESAKLSHARAAALRHGLD